MGEMPWKPDATPDVVSFIALLRRRGPKGPVVRVGGSFVICIVGGSDSIGEEVLICATRALWGRVFPTR